MRSRRLYRFSLFVVFATFVLILAGGLVTSHEAGLAVPDWPTSYGQWFPPMVGNVLWEHSHRMIAAVVGILSLILVIWIQFKERRGWLKILAWFSFLAMMVQALLGGLTVVYLLPKPVSIAHACLGQTFFCLVVALAFFLNPAISKRKAAIPRPPKELSGSDRTRLRRLLMMTAGFIYLQLILGATLRHTGYGTVAHVLVAFLILIHVMLVLLRVVRLPEREAALLPLSLGFGVLTVSQIFLGMGAFIFTRMVSSSYSPSAGEVIFTAAHQTTGAVLLATGVLLTLMVFR
jgi:cytochrome c oxidase assembly protein subunit 15